MLTFLLILAVILFLSIAPVMYTARALGAGRTGIGTVLGALLLQFLLSKIVEAVVGHGLVAFLLGFIGGALIIQFAVVTTFKRALIISVVSSVIAVVGMLVLMKLVGGKPADDADLAMQTVAAIARRA